MPTATWVWRRTCEFVAAAAQSGTVVTSGKRANAESQVPPVAVVGDEPVRETNRGAAGVREAE